jgi:hypothetical protein
MDNTAVFGIMKSRAETEGAVERLKAHGFRNTDISVLFPDNPGTHAFACEKHTKLPEGATGGAASGALVGGALGWLVGIGALIIPGLGSFLAAGPIVAALAGLGVGGTVGGVVGALIGLGVPEYEAKRYEGLLKEGSILISVHSDDRLWTRRAQLLLQAAGARDIAVCGEARADYPATHPSHF